jgi:hypothetical protein
VSALRRSFLDIDCLSVGLRVDGFRPSVAAQTEGEPGTAEELAEKLA